MDDDDLIIWPKGQAMIIMASSYQDLLDGLIPVTPIVGMRVYVASNDEDEGHYIYNEDGEWERV